MIDNYHSTNVRINAATQMSDGVVTEYDDGRLLLERPMLTDNMTRLDNEWLLIDGESVMRTEFSHRVWSAGDLQSLLTRHGFNVVAIYGDYDGADYDLEAERMIVIAEK